MVEGSREGQKRCHKVSLRLFRGQPFCGRADRRLPHRRQNTQFEANSGPNCRHSAPIRVDRGTCQPRPSRHTRPGRAGEQARSRQSRRDSQDPQATFYAGHWVWHSTSNYRVDVVMVAEEMLIGGTSASTGSLTPPSPPLASKSLCGFGSDCGTAGMSRRKPSG